MAPVLAALGGQARRVSGYSVARGRLVPLLLEMGTLAVLALLALQLRLANPEHYSGSFDEGVRAQQLLLMEMGYRPFRDIFASQGPLLLDLLYPLYRLFGSTLGAARIAVGVFSLIGLVGAWWAVRAISPLAGLAAAALLALSPGYLEGSRLALAEVPSLAPCLWAVGCALRWQRGGRPAWIYAAALLATLGVLIKPMAAPALLPIALFALLRRPLRVDVLAGAALLALALGTAVLLLLDAARVAEVLGAYRGGAQGRVGSEALANGTMVARVLRSTEGAGFLLSAAAGALLGLMFWPRLSLGLLAWPVAVAGLFMAYTDLADKHVVYLVPPLALLGGLLPAGLVEAARRRARLHPLHPLVALAGLAALLLYLSGVPDLRDDQRALLRDADERARRDFSGTMEQAELMARLTEPGDFVLTDHPLAAYFARRPVPPWLVDTSGTRVDAGSLTSEVALREAQSYQPRVVVTWRRRLGKLDGFTHWLNDEYRLVKTYPGSDPSTPLKLYVRAELEEPARLFLADR